MIIVLSATVSSMQFSRAFRVAALLLLLSACSSSDTYLDEPLVPADESDVVTSAPFTYGADCPPMNTDPANTSVVYSNTEMGIRFSIPYNEKWGSTAEHFPPYVNHQPTESFPYGYVLFGPPISNFNPDPTLCNPGRSYELTFLPARTANQTVRIVEGRGNEVVPNTTVRTINGLTVVEYTDAGLCSYPTMEVIGTDYNYSFTTGCGTDEEGEWTYLEEIIKTVELTK